MRVMASTSFNLQVSIRVATNAQAPLLVVLEIGMVRDGHYFWTPESTSRSLLRRLGLEVIALTAHLSVPHLPRIACGDIVKMPKLGGGIPSLRRWNRLTDGSEGLSGTT